MQGSEGLLCRYEVLCCASVTEFGRTAGFQVFLERDRTMEMGIDDEQDGDTDERERGGRILSFRLSFSFTRRQEGAMLPQSDSMRRFLSCRTRWSI
jgi:hypothetical protein